MKKRTNNTAKGGSSPASCSVSSCHDCGAKPGEEHMHGCDVERCPDCGYQMISCDCEEITHDRIPWDGEWPGAKACREFDLWCRWGPPWISCERDHPDATEDLNRLDEVADWDADACGYVRKPNARAMTPATDKEMKSNSTAIEGRSSATCSGFLEWWKNHGSGIIPVSGADHEELARRIAELAWHEATRKSNER